MTSRAALITGASSGIGADIARELARHRSSLVLVARRRERLEALAAELSETHRVEVHILDRDLSVPQSAQALYADVQELELEVDVLVNNAGFGMQGPFLGMSADRLTQMFQLNMTTLTELTLLFSRDMAARGDGYILQVASAAAFLPSPYVSAYAATKHYVKAFSEALNFELRPHGVSVTTLYPGITRTEFNAVADASTPPLMRLSVLDADAVARIGVRGLLARKRAVIPGWINTVNAWMSELLPRGIIVWITGRILKSANGHG